MLPKPRIFSALFLGLGITLVVAALVAPRFITTDARLPLNVDTDALTLTLSDPHARFLENGQVSEVGVTKQIHQTIQEPTDSNSVTIRVGVTVMRDGLQSDLERLHEATVWTYRMNRLTGDFESPLTVSYQLAAPTNDVVAEGGWLKFPLDAQKTTYEIFDSTLRQTRPAEFVEELTMSGRTVYHYRQVIEPTNVAELYDSATGTTQLPLPDGTLVPAALFHSGQRDFFVDQRTGLIANVQENIKDYYAATGSGVAVGPDGVAVGPDGAAVGPDGAVQPVPDVTQEVLTFNGEATSSAVAAVLRVASTFPEPGRVQEILKIVTIVGGVIALLGFGGVFGLFGGTDTKRASRRSARRASRRSTADEGNRDAELYSRGDADFDEEPYPEDHADRDGEWDGREATEDDAELEMTPREIKRKNRQQRKEAKRRKRQQGKQRSDVARRTKTVAELQAEYERSPRRSTSPFVSSSRSTSASEELPHTDYDSGA